MAIEASYSLSDGEFPLAAVFRQFPASQIELDRVVPTNKVIIPYFWVRDVGDETISMDDIDHPGIDIVHVVDEVEGDAFIRIDWDFEHESVLTAIIETDVHLVSALGREGRWTFELRADTRQALAEFQSYCRDRDIPIELTELHALAPLQWRHKFDVTDAQREALTLAYARGYYDSPRRATQEDIAEELEISPQALGSRLQRGIRRLISSTLVGDRE